MSPSKSTAEFVFAGVVGADIEPSPLSKSFSRSMPLACDGADASSSKLSKSLKLFAGFVASISFFFASVSMVSAATNLGASGGGMCSKRTSLRSGNSSSIRLYSDARFCVSTSNSFSNFVRMGMTVGCSFGSRAAIFANAVIIRGRMDVYFSSFNIAIMSLVTSLCLIFVNVSPSMCGACTMASEYSPHTHVATGAHRHLSASSCRRPRDTERGPCTREEEAFARRDP